MFGSPDYNYSYPWNNYGVQNTAQSVQQQQTNFSVAFIQGGEAAANSYLVAPNQSVILIDNEAGKLFIKSNASGMPIPMRKFDEIKPVTPQQMQDNFITREEFEKRLAEISNNVPTA